MHRSPDKDSPNGGRERDPDRDGRVERLTSAIARGDGEAFASFYESWFERAYGLARSFTRRDESFCLDIVQDSMLRAIRSLRAMPTEEALARWMARVVLTTAIDHLRRESRKSRRERQACAQRQTSYRENATLAPESQEQLTWLESELLQLPASDRRLLEERFLEEKTLAAVGKAMGLSGHAAHGRIRRLVEGLRAAARRVFHEG